ncbi:MAG: energy-coupling factor ABC transporter ATP-binding protein [Chloroflexota bacterium]|nr:energy-coupling factor ABC transporter ATP-binding protein [Chloroflexota bacterium]
MSLVLAGVGYRYAGATRPSLLDVDLELPDGHVVGLAGPSEAGKTTLCLVASGLAPRTVGGQIRGHISLDGESVDDWPMHRLSQRIGSGFQNPSTQLSQVADTVFEEVAFGPMNLGVERAEVVERTWGALESMAIDGLAEREPQRLSGGQQQLVAMAGLLAMRPEHLVLDEPTAQLDPAGTRMVADAIARLAANGASILVAEQKTDLLAEVASTVVVLAEGRVALHGTAGTVLSDPRLVELGVPEPSAVRLRRMAAAAGVDAARLEAAIGG